MFDVNTLLVSLVSGLMTTLGAVIIILLGDISSRALAAILGFSAGIMLAISMFNLMPAAVQYGGFGAGAIGLALGAAVMLLIDHISAYLGGYFNPAYMSAEYRGLFQAGCMIALGIALHDLPEGLALGAGFEAAEDLGWMLAIAIGLHNIPEGIGIAAPLKLAGVRNGYLLLITTAAGLFTLLGTFCGCFFLHISPFFVGGAMSFAAGAMIYIVSDELIPRSHKQHSHPANLGLILGIILVFLAERI